MNCLCKAGGRNSQARHEESLLTAYLTTAVRLINGWTGNIFTVQARNSMQPGAYECFEQSVSYAFSNSTVGAGDWPDNNSYDGWWGQ